MTGHSIRIHVTSSNYPRFRPNPNTGSSFLFANVTAQTTILFDAAHPSRITLPVVQLSQLPTFPVEDAVRGMLARAEPAWQRVVQSGNTGGDGDLLAYLTRKLAAALPGGARW